MKKPTTRQGQIDLIISQLSYEQLQEFVREIMELKSFISIQKGMMVKLVMNRQS